MSFKKDGRQRNERKLDALFSDGDATIKFAIWADLIDLIKENKYVQVACATSRFWDEEINLYSTPSTMICYLAEDKKISFENKEEPIQQLEDDGLLSTIYKD